MKALIDLQSTDLLRIASWTTKTVDGVDTHYPVKEVIPNSARICQIEENEFEVNPTALLWVDCNTSINTSAYYYDTSDSTIKQLVNADYPS